MSLYKASDTRYTQTEYTPCGRSGLKLPRVSLGLWQNFGSVNVYDNARTMCERLRKMPGNAAHSSS